MLKSPGNMLSHRICTNLSRSHRECSCCRPMTWNNSCKTEDTLAWLLEMRTSLEFWLVFSPTCEWELQKEQEITVNSNNQPLRNEFCLYLNNNVNLTFIGIIIYWYIACDNSYVCYTSFTVYILHETFLIQLLFSSRVHNIYLYRYQVYSKALGGGIKTFLGLVYLKWSFCHAKHTG